MKDLPFLSEPRRYGDTEARDQYETRQAKVKNERNLTGEQIRAILYERSKGWLTAAERNHVGRNENPFDFVLGDETELMMYGFEIKGDTDNFTRLKNQLQAYTFVFAEVYLVLHKKKAPEWLPEHIGIIRVYKNGDAYIEKVTYARDPLDISTDYEWDALFRSNGLSSTSAQVRKVLKMIGDIKRNILFNRFFAKHEGYNTKKFEKFYPFSNEQISIIVGWDVPTHLKLLNKEVKVIEKRLDIIKKACMMGQKGVEDFA